MTFSTTWDPAPMGQVLTPGACRARDEDIQGCALGVLHPRHPHQSTGLRAWLEAPSERALIRCYEAERADALEAMESPLFARFGFSRLVRQDFTHTEAAGLNPTWTLLVGALAPSEKVTIHLRMVCFARPA